MSANTLTSSGADRFKAEAKPYPLVIVDERIEREKMLINRPIFPHFSDFLIQNARVRGANGEYGPYTFEGREALKEIVTLLDYVLREKLTDSEIALAGGAQFGKTILELNLAAYVTGQLFRNFGLYLPDDDLVEGIVDSKFRPDVVDQVEWFAKMVRWGRGLNKSGRAVHRKGAFLVTDGSRSAVGIIRGLGKIPTTFSLDVAAMDEVDDIEPSKMKFVRGRLSASDLRLLLEIGTQRVHGRGMNKAWKSRSQGVIILKCKQCGRAQNPEEEFPQIIRLRNGARTIRSASPNPAIPVGDEATSLHSNESQSLPTSAPTPQLSWTGDFKLPGSETTAATHTPENEYFLGCVKCGAELDRRLPTWEHRKPMLRMQRKWSFRISQLGIDAIDLAQIVARFQSAVTDPEEMAVFRCDVLGLPQSTSQAITPAILDRARSIEAFDLAPRVRENHVAYGGLDMGDRCWFFAREISNFNLPPESSSPPCVPPKLRAKGDGRGQGWVRSKLNSADDSACSNRLLAVEKIASADVVTRVQQLFHQLGLSALFIDERPLVNDARAIALALNGLNTLEKWPKIADIKNAYIEFPGGLIWDGRNSRWLNLKCAVVRFTKTRLGEGITQTIAQMQEGGQIKFVPCIQCNRFETIDRVVREFLTPTEGVVEVVGRKVRMTPGMLLPRQTATSDPILTTLDAHLITGSEREKEADGELGDYVDACDNHLLLADGYSKLAELVCTGNKSTPFAVQGVSIKRTDKTNTRKLE